MNHDRPDPMEGNPYSVKVHDAELVNMTGQANQSIEGVIPYRNPAALVAYYLGLFAFIPLIGLFLAVPAVVLGVMGLRARKRNPEIRGSIHAWIGIVLGSIFTLVWGLLAATILIVAVSQAG